MEKEFVTYEIARKLKDLGFNEPCSVGVKNNERATGCGFGFLNYPNNVHDFTLPLWQQAIDWLREKKGVDLNIMAGLTSYSAKLTGKVESKWFYGSYGHIREEAILKAIELISK